MLGKPRYAANPQRRADRHHRRAGRVAHPTALALGVAQMGAIAVRVTAKLEGAETVEDLAGYMDNWFDLLAVRTPKLSRLNAFADALAAPIMNLRTNDNHPFEILGDLAFVLAERGSWDGLSVVIVGPAGNIARSWFEAAEVLPIEVVQVAPMELLFPASECGNPSSTAVNPHMIKDADLFITDCWPADLDGDAKTALAAFRIDAGLLDQCRGDILFVPCPPVTRGNEVSSCAMRHPKCHGTAAKASLTHIQNAFVESSL